MCSHKLTEKYLNKQMKGLSATMVREQKAIYTSRDIKGMKAVAMEINRIIQYAQHEGATITDLSWSGIKRRFVVMMKRTRYIDPPP